MQRSRSSVYRRDREQLSFQKSKDYFSVSINADGLILNLSWAKIVNRCHHIFRILSLIRSEMIDKTIARARTIRNIQIVP